VLIYPVPVQGATAAAEIVAALRLAGKRQECDVIILARGGGSLEDLWAFNDEALARAIVSSPIPVVSGIGHEIDFTIADFAADVRAPTPSAAAEIVVPAAEEWLISLQRLNTRLLRGVRRAVQARIERLRWLMGRATLVSPAAKLAQQAQRLDDLEQRLSRALRQILSDRRSTLGERRTRLWQMSPVARLQGSMARHAALFARLRAAGVERLRRAREQLLPLVRTLNAVSPLATLDRGYAIVSREDGGILRDAADAAPGSIIEARLARGRIRAKVENPR
jgi:exodeoxyribonuclease VII large subunit